MALVIVTMVASLVPARRATHVDPLVALHVDSLSDARRHRPESDERLFNCAGMNRIFPLRQLLVDSR